MSIQSPKVKIKISNQEMFYISRSIFRRNKKYVRDFSMDGLLIPSHATVQNDKMAESLYNPENQAQDTIFDKYFFTSAHLEGQKCENECQKQRERVLYQRESSRENNIPSRERLSLNGSLITTSSSFNRHQYKQSSSLNNSQINLFQSRKLSIQLKQETKQVIPTLLQSQHDRNYQQLKRRQISFVQDTQKGYQSTTQSYQNQTESPEKIKEVEFPSPEAKQISFRKSQSIFLSESGQKEDQNSINNKSQKRNHSSSTPKPNRFEDQNEEQIEEVLDTENTVSQVVDNQILEYQKRDKLIKQTLDTSIYNAGYQWKNIRKSSPAYSFYKSSERKTIFESPNKVLDDEMRYNNFQISSPDFNHTIEIEKVSQRDYKVFQQDHLNDLLYPKSGSQYESVAYDSRTLKCNFDIAKFCSSSTSRKFYREQHKNDKPATILDNDKVLAAKNKVQPQKRYFVPQFNKIISREAPASSPFCLLKDNENPYVHQAKEKKKIKFLFI